MNQLKKSVMWTTFVDLVLEFPDARCGHNEHLLHQKKCMNSKNSLWQHDWN